MSIKEEYANYTPGLMYFIGDKNPVMASNDARMYSYFIPLRNFKKGFDYYELNKHKSGSVYFSVVTMLGFKTVLRTDSRLIETDLTEMDWANLVGDISNTHFMREEYQALKKGYVKKGGGCMASVVLSLIFLLSLTLVL